MDHQGSQSGSRKAYVLFFGLVPFAFYWYTAAPTIGLGDTALLIDGIQRCAINSHVNNHNLTVLVGWLFSFLPVGNIAYRGTLSSVFLGAVAVSLFFRVQLRLGRTLGVAGLVALVLMVSHSQWWHSSIVECYAFNAIFTTLALYLLARIQEEPDRDGLLYWLFFVSGLAIFNHVQLGFIWCGGMVILLHRMWSRFGKKNQAVWSLFGWSVAAFWLGFLPWALTFLKDVYSSGNAAQVASWALGGDFKGIMFKGTLWHGLQDVAFLIFQQFPSPFLLAIPLGVFYLFRQWGVTALALAAMFLVNTYFFALYNTWDKFAFLLPSFQMLAFIGSFGVEGWMAGCRLGDTWFVKSLNLCLAISCVILPPWFYSRLAPWGRNPDSYWYARYNNIHTANTHDVAEYIANPNKRHYDDVETFANLLFEKLPPNAVFIDDDSRTYYPLADYYQKLFKKRPDVNIQIVNSWGFDNWGATTNQFALMVQEAWSRNRPFFLVSLGHPFPGFLSTLSDPTKYRFVRFPLDDTRWVYRLATAAEASGAVPLSVLPTIDGLETGVGFNADAPVTKDTFKAGEAVMARLQFASNVDPFYIQFRWRGPDGHVFFASVPFLVAPNNTSVWSYFEKASQAIPGTWTLQAMSDENLLAERKFILQP